MSRSSDNKRSGYVTLLAVTFAFGLATLGTALAVSARSYLASAASRERTILDRISLESVAALTLADLAIRNERPLRSVSTASINGRSIAIELSIPETKFDLTMDDEQTIRKAWADFPGFGPAEFMDGLAPWSRSKGSTAVIEDCARTYLTFGRAPEPLDATLIRSEAPEALRLVSGDQVDLRIRVSGKSGRTLWVRERFIGPGWSRHDYRMLAGTKSQPCAQG